MPSSKHYRAVSTSECRLAGISALSPLYSCAEVNCTPCGSRMRVGAKFNRIAIAATVDLSRIELLKSTSHSACSLPRRFDRLVSENPRVDLQARKTSPPPSAFSNNERFKICLLALFLSSLCVHSFQHSFVWHFFHSSLCVQRLFLFGGCPHRAIAASQRCPT